MNIKQLLKTTPETLAQEQYDALQAAVADRLRTLAGHIAAGRFQAVDDALCSSPAGDCMGCDNTCIDFSDMIEPCMAGCSTDLGDVVVRLTALQNIIIGAGKT